MKNTTHLLLGCIALLACSPVHGQETSARSIALPRQALGQSVRDLGARFGINVVAPSDLLAGRTAPAISGRYEARAALSALLAGSGLHAELNGDTWIILADAPDDGEWRQDASVRDIVVTGTRLRGAPVASPVIGIDRRKMRDAARADLGDVVRRIPQSFGGGQNPGIGSNVPTGSGGDVGGGSSLNLRGLGSDATLTLLNGRRLAYTAALQSVDVSAIPLAAVERIEIVPDGASAIYGSDAVAGVANIILRRDYNGLETGARLAATSGGGGFQQRYDALAGGAWASGGVMAAYEHGSSSAIRANDRSYARTRSPGLDLFPALAHDSVAASAHQSLGETVTASVDGLFNRRTSEQTLPTRPGGDLSAGRATFFSTDKSWGVAPSLEWRIGGGWRASLSGTYGEERVDFHQLQCAAAACTDSGANFYRNTARSFELGGDGPLFTLPGGDARLALGGGYRRIGFQRFSASVSAVNTRHAQDSVYGYAELGLPLIGPDQTMALVERLDVDLAARYERYPGIGDVLTPKIGAAWGVTPDVALKGSWGRSYRAPTLFQQYQPRAAALYPPRFIGAPGLPATAAAILIVGGNPDLKPERARTWSATLDLHPRALPGARLQLSWFDVAYRDRIVAPIALLAQALSNPLYADRVIRNPDAATQAAAIAAANSFTNFLGSPYVPANVIALIDNAYVNAGRQSAHGIDLLASYDASLGARQSLSLAANISYLKSAQQLTASQPVTPLAGIIFNPPHWRGHASASWSAGAVTVTADAGYTGRVRDTRFAPAVDLRGVTTLDLSARYRVAGTGTAFDGLEFTLSAQNLFNAKPAPIATTAPSHTPYDSTNYSPVGRLLALEVRKTW
jgi:outer membrane receptor protein involved in Fe transport